MKRFVDSSKKRRKPFNRQAYKQSENLLVNRSLKCDSPITRTMAKEIISNQKERHRFWFKRK